MAKGDLNINSVSATKLEVKGQKVVVGTLHGHRLSPRYIKRDGTAVYRTAARSGCTVWLIGEDADYLANYRMQFLEDLSTSLAAVGS